MVKSSCQQIFSYISKVVYSVITLDATLQTLVT
uniref:Uncharacterized protein n=1 Tax=Anguilla anguilla TaxID=7936 RepID=A0A0E9UWQ6_ANGAN